MNLDQVLDKMWQDYLLLNPLANKVKELLMGENEEIVNDHIALRTFNHPKINIDVLSQFFLKNGYKQIGEYEFTEKKLFAKHFEHMENSNYPKIFISELKLENFSERFNTIIESLVNKITKEDLARPDFFCLGRPWSLDSTTYFELNKESEYGSWVAAFGYRPNHFTILVNALKKYDSLEKLNSFLKSNDILLNSSGGEIKGSAKELLEQSSTLSNKINVKFDDTNLDLPACYFEFAKRYQDTNGKLYQGFIAKSADKIFESTNRGQ